MKKLILLILIGLGAWNFYRKPSGIAVATPSTATEKTEINEASASAEPAASFSCDGRVYCSQMKSRAEADFFSSHCPGTKMDGDHDGAACENDSRF